MTTQPKPHGEFTVNSECLCYGELHNMFHGSSQALQAFPPAVEIDDGGTVRTQIVEYNIVAKNGTWNVYQLMDRPSKRLCGWFACHSTVEPESEVDRILRVSGSPYEENSGSRFNDESTFAEAVFVINRYDWGYYDNRGKEGVHEDEEADIEEYHVALGLLDYEKTVEGISSWQKDVSKDRKPVPNGFWMHIPLMEYMFGRFGFDKDRQHAQSFLFFTTDTCFDRTVFSGTDKTLREPYTGPIVDEDGLEKGPSHDSGEGIIMLKQKIAAFSPDLPSEAEYLGPYDSKDFVLQDSDLEAIRARRGVAAAEFQQKQKICSYACLNQMVMSFLEHYIGPASSHESVSAAAESLWPTHGGNPGMLESCMSGFLLHPHSDPVEGFDAKETGKRIKKFLGPRCSDNSLIRNELFIEGVVAVVVYVLSEILELSDNNRKNSNRQRLFPLDIRAGTFHDDEILELIKYSQYFWTGDNSSGNSN